LGQGISCFIGVFAFAVAVAFEIHLGLPSALEVSHFGLGACWDPILMNWGCYLKHGLWMAKALNAVTRLRDCFAPTSGADFGALARKGFNESSRMPGSEHVCCVHSKKSHLPLFRTVE
jgi:hypothetical protein